MGLGIQTLGVLCRYGIGTFNNLIIAFLGIGDGNVDPKNLSSRR